MNDVVPRACFWRGGGGKVGGFIEYFERAKERGKIYSAIRVKSGPWATSVVTIKRRFLFQFRKFLGKEILADQKKCGHLQFLFYETQQFSQHCWSFTLQCCSGRWLRCPQTKIEFLEEAAIPYTVCNTTPVSWNIYLEEILLVEVTASGLHHSYGNTMLEKLTLKTKRITSGTVTRIHTYFLYAVSKVTYYYWHTWKSPVLSLSDFEVIIVHTSHKTAHRCRTPWRIRYSIPGRLNMKKKMLHRPE